MPILGYRTQQSTDTTGTGTLALNAAPSAMRSFQVSFGTSARRVLYCLSWATGFEIGHGQFDGSSPGALTRATVLASSNAGNPVALPAGTKDVFAVLEPNAREVLAIGGSTSLGLAELGNLVVFAGTAAATLGLPTLASVPLGMSLLVRNSGTADLTLDPAGSETVNGGLTVTLNPGFSAELFNTGAGWTALLAAPQNFGRIVSELIPIAGQSLPPLCVWPNGQNLSRSGYAALFAAIGTTYRAGDGSTTFGVPDLRGRTLFGRDNLGGAAAGRLTPAVSGVDGASLGAAGGDERLHAHGHGVNDPTHAHTGATDVQGDHAHYTRLNARSGNAAGANPDPGWGADNFQQGPFDAWTSIAGAHAHNLSTYAAGTGISIQSAGAGGAQNVPPALVCHYVLFAGV